ncbi:MAG TPA: SRPBCC family protein [Paludibacteraceae bacterium]|nr:SRPBCC family protein [Paludibacteraceae bacterium]HPT42317.1 SRPBCC family protein [Paludibacteraceae bacterium]
MTTYESDIKTISSSGEVVFNILSNLSNFNNLQNLNADAQEKLNQMLKDVEFDENSCRFTVDGVGRVGFRIIEREPFKTIKLEAENSPVAVNGWIQLVQVSETDTRMKLTLKADIPTMIKVMVDSKLKKGINTIADTLVQYLTYQIGK